MSGEGPNERETPSREEVDAALQAAGAGDVPGDAASTGASSADVPAAADAAASGGTVSADGAASEEAVRGEGVVDGAPAEGAPPGGKVAQEATEPPDRSNSTDEARVGGADSAGDADPTGLSEEDINAAMAAATESAGTDGGASTGRGGSGDVRADSKKPSQAEVDAALQGAVEAVAAPTANADGSRKPDSTGRPLDGAAAMMEAAIEEEKAAAATGAGGSGPALSPAERPHVPPPEGSVPLALPDFSGPAEAIQDKEGMDLLNDVDLNVKIELGRAQMLIESVLRLGVGSVVELNKLAGDPVDVLVNEKLVARGEVLVLNDNFCVRINEIVAGLGLEDGR